MNELLLKQVRLSQTERSAQQVAIKIQQLQIELEVIGDIQCEKSRTESVAAENSTELLLDSKELAELKDARQRRKLQARREQLQQEEFLLRSKLQTEAAELRRAHENISAQLQECGGALDGRLDSIDNVLVGDLEAQLERVEAEFGESTKQTASMMSELDKAPPDEQLYKEMKELLCSEILPPILDKIVRFDMRVKENTHIFQLERL
ncbi:MAG: hypothetical protein MHM6MM_006140 [Cercozoa sp. M6MM]